MKSTGTIVATIFLASAVLLGVWAYQRKLPDQEVNALDKPPETNAVILPDNNTSIVPVSVDWTLETPIGKIVADRPETARVLELVGIDYCCGGQAILEAAAADQNVDPEQLLSALLVVGTSTLQGEYRDWQHAELDELVDHIVSTHHAWLRRELPPLTETTETVLLAHGESHTELADVAATLDRIRTSVLPHLDEEEQHLFPAIRELAQGKSPNGIGQQLAAMRTDHDAIGEDLHRLRELTGGFALPSDGCLKYQEMLHGLAALERDLHQHVHLENNVLLPKALDLLADGNINQDIK